MIRFSLRFLFAGFFVACAGFAHAQTDRVDGRGCLSPVPPPEWDNWFNQLTREYSQRQLAGTVHKTNVYKLPVIVHVIHSGEPLGVFPNISRQQVESQFAVLNADFSGTGHGVAGVPDPFKDDVANCDIVFSPAQLDPDGKPLVVPGIHRVDWHDIGSNADPEAAQTNNDFQSRFDKYIKPATIWDPERYFNIWVSSLRNSLSLIGYATFPLGSGLEGAIGGGTAISDGVWIFAAAFGTVGVQPPFDYGRTVTHEIGHWLGLRHIWGDATCGDDYCDDTPQQHKENYGCKMTFPKISCNNGPDGEMFMNFMDYGDDPCITMFTWDQRVRMHTAMQNGIYRKNLTASSATLCDLEPVQPVAAFSVPSPACTNTFVTVSNQSSGIPGPNSAWNIEPSDGVRLAVDHQSGDLILVAEVPGNYSLTLTATNAKGQSSTAQVIELTDCGIMPGIDETLRNSVPTVFPNPAEGVFTVTAHGKCIRVDVFDAMGELTFSRSGCEKIVVDATGSPGGIYFAVITGDGIRQVKKLVISR